MPCCSVSRSRISFCLPCHVRDSRSIWFIFISASSHPDCRARTATGPRDARRPRPPRRTATGHTTGQRAPPVGAAPSPRPRAKPRADSRARMARTKGGRDPTRGPHAHRATAHPIQSPPALRAVRASSRAAASIAADAAENATPSPPASCPRSTRPDRDFRPVSETPTRRTLPFTHPTRPARTVPHTYAVRLHDGSTHTASTHSTPLSTSAPPPGRMTTTSRYSLGSTVQQPVQHIAIASGHLDTMRIWGILSVLMGVAWKDGGCFPPSLVPRTDRIDAVLVASMDCRSASTGQA